MRTTTIASLALLLLSGCASTPKVAYQYYPARAITSVTVTQTVECEQKQIGTGNGARTQLAMKYTHAPTVATSYASDRKAKARTLNTSEFRGAFTDSNIAFGWFDDGRLKSINQSSTGQGEAIVKAAMSFVPAVIGAGLLEASAGKAECDELSKLGGGKPLTLVYETKIDHATPPADDLNLELQPAFKPLSEQLPKHIKLPVLQVRLEPPQELAPLVIPNASQPDTVELELNKIGTVSLQVLANKVAQWNGTVTVPTAKTYPLLIPKPKLFGSQTFSLTLNEAGAITAMSYGNTSGGAGAINALNSAVTTFDPSDATEANAMKAEADLIAQTQRLAACRAKPTECK